MHQLHHHVVTPPLIHKMALRNRQMNSSASLNGQRQHITVREENDGAFGGLVNNKSKASRQPLKAIDVNLVANRGLAQPDLKKQKTSSSTFSIFVDAGSSSNPRQSTSLTSSISSDDDSYRLEQSGLRRNDSMDDESTESLTTDSLVLTSVDEAHEHDEEIYSTEVFQYMLSKESSCMPKSSYMLKQRDINHAMRTILIDWMVEVSEEMKLTTETLCIAVNITDRFLSKMMVLRSKLQLVGASALFLAAKYEEIYPPGVKDLIYLTDDCYTVDQLLRMERLLLHVLEYRVSPPTPSYFLLCMGQWMQCDKVALALAQYILELAMTQETYICHLPSVLAAASIAVAHHILGYTPWTEEATRVTGYQATDLTKCTRDLCDVMRSSVNADQRAVREKYSKGDFYEVAYLNPPSRYPF